MNEALDPLAWVDRAEEDYVVARSALRRKRPLTSSACFHAQQCAEKYLKALLVAHGRPFPKIHDLYALSDLCEEAGLVVGVDKDRLDALSACAVHARYPGREPAIDEARDAIETATGVRRFARRLLGLK